MESTVAATSKEPCYVILKNAAGLGRLSALTKRDRRFQFNTMGPRTFASPSKLPYHSQFCYASIGDLLCLILTNYKLAKRFALLVCR